MVGASGKPEKPSHRIFSYLKAAGYRVVPVNPLEEHVLGERAYPTLEEVPGQVDIVDVFRRAEHAPEIARAAAGRGAGALWLQLGIVNEEAAALAQAKGLTVVMDRCIAVVHSSLGIPPVRGEAGA